MQRKLSQWKILLVVLLASVVSACMFDDDDDNTITTGLYTVQSSGVEREYYLQLPTDYESSAYVQITGSGEDKRKPLLFTYHGYTGSYENWVGDKRFYDLVDVVGDDAIIVAPNGLPDASGKRVWGGEDDLNFFVDMLAELDRRGLQYNPNKIFVAGHSNGAGFAHELGCRYGDVIRAIALAAGALTSTDCAGSMAVLMFQGRNDPLTNYGIARGALRYWVLYNGWDEDVYTDASVGPCNDYSAAEKPANLPYGVVWCEHTQGHDWPDYGSQTAWDWLSALSEEKPTPDAPAGGGSERATPPRDAYLTFQIEVPAEASRPLQGAASLRPLSFIDNPTCSAPDVILNFPFSVDGKLVPGELSERITIPITYLIFSGGLEFPSDWALSITVYVEGGSTSVIPTPGVDFDVNVPVTLVGRNSDVNVDQILTLTPVADLCGF